ncbi:hypothetical protein EL75_4777 [Escherichia coli]|nr:hypothetical protein EL75_4777 [Escherichia coli]KGM76188.1 hypothetical protein EL80_5172 [Escherichia coli]
MFNFCFGCCIVRFYYTGAVAHAIAIDFSETNN